MLIPGMEKLFVSNLHPWGQLDWFALKWNYLIWRLMCLLVQHMQMAPQPLNYMMVHNYPQARQYHLEPSIQTRPLRLPLWRGAVGCARIVAPGTAPANLSLHSVGLSLFSCRRRSLTLLKAGSGFVHPSLLWFDTFIVHSSCSYGPDIHPVTESSQKAGHSRKNLSEKSQSLSSLWNETLRAEEQEGEGWDLSGSKGLWSPFLPEPLHLWMLHLKKSQ